MKKQVLFLFTILLLGFSIVSAQTQTIPKIIAGGVVNGKAINLPAPKFPAAAKAVNASGAVNVKVTIDENGSVTEAIAVSGHPLLRKAAEDAALQAKFAGTQLSGQPVKVTGVIIYNFTPSGSVQANKLPTYSGPGNAVVGDRMPPQRTDNTISGGVLNGKARNLAVPAYPAAAKAVGASGAVNVQVVIDEDGNVISANSVSGHPLLRDSSEKAARESKFSPTLLQGRTVKVTGIIVYNYLMPMPWIQIGYELSLAKKSLFLKDYPVSSISGTFPVDWTEEKADLEKIRDYLIEKTKKEKIQQKETEQKNVTSAALSAENLPNEIFTVRGTGLTGDENYQLDIYSAEMLDQLQSKIENRLFNTNKILYFKFGKNLGKLIAEIDDDQKASTNSQELYQLAAANSSTVSNAFAASINNIIEISMQNISGSDKKEKVIAVIKRLQDY